MQSPCRFVLYQAGRLDLFSRIFSISRRLEDFLE